MPPEVRVTAIRRPPLGLVVPGEITQPSLMKIQYLNKAIDFTITAIKNLQPVIEKTLTFMALKVFNGMMGDMAKAEPDPEKKKELEKSIEEKEKEALGEIYSAKETIKTVFETNRRQVRDERDKGTISPELAKGFLDEIDKEEKSFLGGYDSGAEICGTASLKIAEMLRDPATRGIWVAEQKEAAKKLSKSVVDAIDESVIIKIAVDIAAGRLKSPLEIPEEVK